MTTPWTTSHQIKNFGKSFLDHPYYILSVSDICPRAEKIFFKEIHQFYTLYLKIILGAGVTKFTILYPTAATNQTH